MKTTASVRVDRPIDEVFAYVTDVSRMTEWVSGVSEARLLSDKIERGARYVLVYTGMIRRPAELEVEVTEYERPRVFGSRTARGPFEVEDRIELIDDDGQTIVTSTVRSGDDLATRITWSLLGWLITKPWISRLQTELERLAASVERNATAR